MDLEKLKAEHPALYMQVTADAHKAGYAEGQKAENARIAAIESIKAPGYEGVIAAHKFNSEMDKNSVSALILDEQAKTHAKAAADYAADGKETTDAASKIDKGEATTTSNEEEEKALFANARAGAQR